VAPGFLTTSYTIKMKYLKTQNATVQRTVGITSVTFEPVYRIGGSWIGIFETEDEKLAENLLTIGSITEIDKSEYDALKKKLQTNSASSQNSARPQPVASVRSPDVPLAEEDGEDEPEKPLPEIKVAEVKPDNGPVDTVPTKPAPKKRTTKKKTTQKASE